MEVLDTRLIHVKVVGDGSIAHSSWPLMGHLYGCRLYAHSVWRARRCEREKSQHKKRRQWLVIRRNISVLLAVKSGESVQIQGLLTNEHGKVMEMSMN